MDAALAGGGFAALFASPTLVSLLRLFLARPDTDFYQRELAGLTGSRLVQVQRDLLRLEGLVWSRDADTATVSTTAPAAITRRSPTCRRSSQRPSASPRYSATSLMPLRDRVDLAFVYGLCGRRS